METLVGRYKMNSFIIAEAGVNHNGSIELALRMIDAAKVAGADAIKFQSFKAKNLVSKQAKLAEYQERHDIDSQYSLLKPLEVNKKGMRRLKDYCDRLDIKFMSSPFDVDSLQELVDIGMDIIKIPSGEITNLPLLEAIGETGLEVIMSTGMSTMIEIKSAIRVLEDRGAGGITVLHCNTEYPTPMEDVNLRVMKAMRDELDKPIGYSDHTLGIEIPIAAVALGATVIEKHFTLDKSLSGPDHKASLEPSELKGMIQGIRNIERAMGDGKKTVSNSEKKNKGVVRKSIVAKHAIKKGEIITSQDITTKRPGSGISPMDWYRVIGKVAKKDFEADELIVL